MTQEEIKVVLEKHGKWLRGEKGGTRANLYRANLYRANLYRADLYRANLSDAKNLVYPLACPDTGAFVGWKKCRGQVIVHLEIPADARRSSATGRKCRCDKAKVISIVTPDGSAVEEAHSGYAYDFVYRVGETVIVNNFDENRWKECAPGIHFFINRQEAEDYYI